MAGQCTSGMSVEDRQPSFAMISHSFFFLFFLFLAFSKGLEWSSFHGTAVRAMMRGNGQVATVPIATKKQWCYKPCTLEGISTMSRGSNHCSRL